MTGQRDILQGLENEHREGKYDVVRENFTLFGNQLRAWSTLVTGPPAIQKCMPRFFDNHSLYSLWTFLESVIVFHLPLQSFSDAIREVDVVVFCVGSSLLPGDSRSGCYRYNLDYVGVISHRT